MLLAVRTVPMADDESGASGAARAGVEAAAATDFGQFYDRTRGALRAYLAAATRAAGLADDLTQEAFLRLYTAKKTFTSDEHRRRYLFRIASNLLVDHWRTARHATLPLDDALLARPLKPAFQEPASDLDARRDILRALGKLQPRERQLVWLAHVESLDHRAIAAIVGVSSASVRVLLFRARRRFAAALDEGVSATAAQGADR